MAASGARTAEENVALKAGFPSRPLRAENPQPPTETDFLCSQAELKVGVPGSNPL